MSKNPPNLSEYLKKSREQAGLTQVELARRLGIQQSAISHIERGENAPQWSTLVRWVEICQVP